jgi:hypothetical protein
VVIPAVLMRLRQEFGGQPRPILHFPSLSMYFRGYESAISLGVMINSLSSLNQGPAPVSGNAASNAKASSTSQPADSAASFISQFMASMGQQQGSKPGSSQNNNPDSLMSMLDASNTSVPNASMYSMTPASLYSAEL